MFIHLLESAAVAQRRPGWTLASTAVHTAIVATAVALTLPGSSPQVARAPKEHLLYTVQPRSTPRTSPRVSARPAPQWSIPRDVPVALPELPQVATLSEPPLVRIGPELLGPGLSVSAHKVAAARDRLYSEQHVDRPVTPRRNNPEPVYPDALRSAFIEGGVTVQFIVDTTGRVELQSIVIIQSTHERFADAVRHWLALTRYRPADAGGRAVRQLVQQKVGFALRP